MTDLASAYYNLVRGWEIREVLDDGTIMYSEGYRGGILSADIAERLREVVAWAPATAWIDAPPSALGLSPHSIIVPDSSRHPTLPQSGHPLMGCQLESARKARKAVRRVRGGDVSGAIALLDLAAVQLFALSAIEGPAS